MTLSHSTTTAPGPALSPLLRPSLVRARQLFQTGGIAASASLVMLDHAFAAGTSSTNGLGAQLNTMSSEMINSGGTLAGAVFYGLALICFGAGVWALWQSRQPQNRESGRLAMGLAGLVLCGLFVTGGTWINKAANSASGGDATIGNTAAEVAFK